jgi:OOP family OmpA-OmpF porin
VVDARGCPKDSDGDGVFDGIDRCPDTPKGCQVDAAGCPKDSDGDGVCDGIDRCPDTPRGTKVDVTGCPIAAPKAPPVFEPGKKVLVLEGVNFEYDKAVLTADSTATLDKVLAGLRDWPEVRVEIGGHTDSRGTDAYNQKLSERRSEAVKAYFAERGIDPSRLTTRGFGESQPLADNKTDEGRARNRRVELTKLD